MKKLRDKETGCPWDQVQNFESIARYTIEEAYVEMLVNFPPMNHSHPKTKLIKLTALTQNHENISNPNNNMGIRRI